MSRTADRDGIVGRASSGGPLVRVERLAKFYAARGPILAKAKIVRAVDGVTFTVRHSETLGVVGPSGSGKTTLGHAIIRLTELTYGRIRFEGTDISDIRGRALARLRKSMQIVFQEPWASLGTQRRVKEILAEPIESGRVLQARSEIDARVEILLRQVGLSPDCAETLPHELGAGEQQRVALARALASEPTFIVLDEPTRALDVSGQAKIANMLLDLQTEYAKSYLFISHDLKLVEHMSHRVAVMYLGRIVELGPTASLYERKLHPYTRALFSAVPAAHPNRRRLRVLLEGDTPSPLVPPPGCAFHPRCPRFEPGKCDVQAPDLAEAERGSHHRVACHHPHL
jgi:oligopeptide transport system ATP-binding protein